MDNIQKNNDKEIIRDDSPKKVCDKVNHYQLVIEPKVPNFVCSCVKQWWRCGRRIWAFVNGEFNMFSLMSSQPQDFPGTLHTRRGI